MMRMESAGFRLRCFYKENGEWIEIPQDAFSKSGFLYETKGARYVLRLAERAYGYDYELKERAERETGLRLLLDGGDKTAFHVIPCNIYGDNNIDRVKPGEFPSLTGKHPGTRFCSPVWELRADRAAVPLCAMSTENGAAGISIEPYAKLPEGVSSPERKTEEAGGSRAAEGAAEYIHNGVYAALPAQAGVVLGYENRPATFVDKGHEEAPTAEYAREAAACGSIFCYPGEGKAAVHKMVRRVYERLHVRAAYKNTFSEAARAVADAFIELNWNEKWQAYTDMSCQPPAKPELTAWRPVYEIGWTGIGEIACPMVMAKELLGLLKEDFGSAKTGEELIDQIITAYNPASGLLNDLVAPIDESGSLVNGWWIWYKIAQDCHCAYNNGKAVHEILKTIIFLKERKRAYPQRWLETCLKVLDTAAALQREDGNYGYTYSTEEKKVLDWEGFAGCWFMPCMVYAWQLSGKVKYLESARLAERFYGKYVRELNCYGTPMDTWKAVDEEGNLAYIRGCRLLHEATGKACYLRALEDGAHYEYLWRYGYRTRPENPPLKEGWIACGGSVTSISNPHIHPMGVIVDDDLRYLARQTQDTYHRCRADDSTAWLMQNLECYPKRTGYGRYGIMSERFCPSDGLVTERYSDGRAYSSWFTYNMWAAANVLEALADLLWEEKRDGNVWD